jgi:hypothetical protein
MWPSVSKGMDYINLISTFAPLPLFVFLPPCFCTGQNSEKNREQKVGWITLVIKKT